MNKLKMIKSTLLAAFSILLLGSCMKTEESEPLPPASYVAVINAYKDEPSVHPQINGQNLYSGTGIPFGEISANSYYNMPYIDVISGTHKLSFINNGNQGIGSELTQLMEEDSFYSWFIYGTEDDTRHTYIEDPIIGSTNDNTPKIRFFNLASGIDEVELHFEFEDPESASGERREIIAETNRAQENQASMEEHKAFTPNTDVTNRTNIRVKDAAEEDSLIAELENYNFQPYYHYTILFINDRKEDDDEENTDPSYKIIVYYFRY